MKYLGFLLTIIGLISFFLVLIFIPSTYGVVASFMISGLGIQLFKDNYGLKTNDYTQKTFQIIGLIYLLIAIFIPLFIFYWHSTFPAIKYPDIHPSNRAPEWAIFFEIKYSLFDFALSHSLSILLGSIILKHFINEIKFTSKLIAFVRLVSYLLISVLLRALPFGCILGYFILFCFWIFVKDFTFSNIPHLFWFKFLIINVLSYSTLYICRPIYEKLVSN
jgi:hypothetical protein